MDTEGSIPDGEEFESTGLFYEVFSVSPASIIICTLEDKRFVSVNDGFTRLVGYDREEVLGKTIEELGLMLRPKGEQRIFRRLKEGQTVRWHEGRIRRKDGELRDVVGSFLPVEAGGVAYAVQKLIDITRIKELQQEVLKVSDRERHRLGRDLHDDIGQRLTGLMHLAKALEQQMQRDAPDQLQTLEMIREQLASTNEELRRLARGMTPVEIVEEGLRYALGHLCDSVAALYNVTCELEADKGISVDPQIGEHFYRIAQEAVNNAVRHGNADHISLRLTREDDGLVLEVVDNGIGIDETIIGSAEGIGLRTMRYRARTMGGTLEIRRREDGGTLVCCAVPGGALGSR